MIISRTKVKMHSEGSVISCVIPKRRIIFLETVAGVPGMVAAMTRHLQSLRRMRRDHGWIHTLLGILIILRIVFHKINSL